jgi:hypothetical protein
VKKRCIAIIAFFGLNDIAYRITGIDQRAGLFIMVRDFLLCITWILHVQHKKNLGINTIQLIERWVKEG